MEKISTAEEFKQQLDKANHSYTDEYLMVEFAKLHVQAALEEASEKAEIGEFYVFGSTEDEDFFDQIDMSSLRCNIKKDSILNAYPLDKIK